LQLFGNGHEFLGGRCGQFQQRLNARPRASPIQFTLMLAAFCTQDEGLLCTDNVQPQFAHRTGGAGRAAAQLGVVR
jgi:hypothetical protein